MNTTNKPYVVFVPKYYAFDHKLLKIAELDRITDKCFFTVRKFDTTRYLKEKYYYIVLPENEAAKVFNELYERWGIDKRDEAYEIYRSLEKYMRDRIESEKREMFAQLLERSNGI